MRKSFIPIHIALRYIKNIYDKAVKRVKLEHKRLTSFVKHITQFNLENYFDEDNCSTEDSNNGIKNITDVQETVLPKAMSIDFDSVIIDDTELFFNEFWKAYPRKESKQQAKKVWMKLKPNQEFFRLITNALEYCKQTEEWLAEGGHYIPNPVTWLNGKQWED